MRRPRFLLQCGLLLTLLVFSIGIIATRFEPRRPGSHAKPQLVILPGRETLVMNFLEPVLKTGFSGMKISNISIDRAEIRLQLEPAKDSFAALPAPCPLPPWAHDPGTVIVLPRDAPTPECVSGMHCGSTDDGDLRLSWASCATSNAGDTSAAHWIKTLAARNHREIWEAPPGQRIAYSPKEGGLLAPIILTTGLEKTLLARLLMALSLGISILAAIVLRQKLGPSPILQAIHTPEDRKVIHQRLVFLGIMVIVGTALRIHAAATLPPDPDEGLVVQQILSGNHDSWVHPPLHGIVNNLWIQTMHLGPETPIWKFRLPSIFFSLFTLCFSALSLAFSRLPGRVEIPFAAFALLPTIAADNVLVRPYGLALFGATLSLVALSARDLYKNEKEDWFSWFVALVALGLTVWTDLLTALFVGCFIFARWVHRRAFTKSASFWSRFVIATSVIAWALPFMLGLPGSLEASRELDWPYHAESNSTFTIQSIARVLLQLVGAPSLRAYLGNPGVVAIFIVGVIYVVIATRRKNSSLAFGFGLFGGMIVILMHYMGMRTRNLLFLPAALAVVGAIIAPRWPKSKASETSP